MLEAETPHLDQTGRPAPNHTDQTVLGGGLCGAVWCNTRASYCGALEMLHYFYCRRSHANLNVIVIEL